MTSNISMEIANPALVGSTSGFRDPLVAELISQHWATLAPSALGESVLSELVRMCRENVAIGKSQDRGIALDSIPETLEEQIELFNWFQLKEGSYGETLEACGELQVFIVRTLWQCLGGIARSALSSIRDETTPSSGT
jgi:hypothetical protein